MSRPLSIASEPQTFVVIITTLSKVRRVSYHEWVEFANDAVAFIKTEGSVDTVTFSQPDNPQPTVVVTGQSENVPIMMFGLDETEHHHETISSEIRVIVADKYYVV